MPLRRHESNRSFLGDPSLRNEFPNARSASVPYLDDLFQKKALPSSSGAMQKKATEVLSPSMRAQEIKRALQASPVDKVRILQMLSQVAGKANELNELRAAYREYTDRNLMYDLRHAFQEEDLAQLVSNFHCDPDGQAQLLYHAMKDNGTDNLAVEETLKLIRSDPSAGRELRNAFKARYGGDLRDWIKGDYYGEGEEEILGMFGNEFLSMERFTELTGRTELGRYEWLKEDRENNLSGTFDKAMEAMTRDQAQDVLLPFEQVRDYYIWIDRKLQAKGNHSRWVKGALYLVDELTDTFEEGSVATGNWSFGGAQRAIPLLEDLNVGIANYAITQFYRLLYGDLKDNPLLGDDAYEFDRDFVKQEQGSEAFKIYNRYKGSTELRVLNQMFNGKGYTGSLLPGLRGNGKWGTHLS